MLLQDFRAAVQRLKSVSENGFSLIEIVVTTAIILTITAVGVAPFGDIVDDSRQGAIETAFDQTENIVLKYYLDGDEATDPLDAAEIFNQGSTEQYGVTVDVREDDGNFLLLAIHSPHEYSEDALASLPAEDWDSSREVNRQ